MPDEGITGVRSSVEASKRIKASNRIAMPVAIRDGN
jgi:hypothetical protein